MSPGCGWSACRPSRARKGTETCCRRIISSNPGPVARLLPGQMPNETPSPLELYVRTLFAPEDGALTAVAPRQAQAGLPPIQISPEEGKLIAVLLAAVGAK